MSNATSASQKGIIQTSVLIIQTTSGGLGNLYVGD